MPDPSESRLLRDELAGSVGHTKKLESAVEEMSQIIAELGADNAGLGAENAGLRAEITVLKRVP